MHAFQLFEYYMELFVKNIHWQVQNNNTSQYSYVYDICTTISMFLHTTQHAGERKQTAHNINFK